MTDKHTQAMAEQGNMQKDPEDWVTGDEPMTGAQRSYLKTLCEEAKEEFDENLSKADASKRIDDLQAKTGRGQHARAGSDAERTHPDQHAMPPHGEGRPEHHAQHHGDRGA